MKKLKLVSKFIETIKNTFVIVSKKLKSFSKKQRILIVIISFVALFIMSLFLYKPILSNVYWKMAVKVSATDFDKAINYIDKAYGYTQEEFLIDVKISFYIKEARIIMKSDPDKALALLEESYKIKQTVEARDLIISICIDLANSFYDTDIDKCIYYINKGLFYGTNDSLIALSKKAYTRLAQLKNSEYALDKLKDLPPISDKDVLEEIIEIEDAIIKAYPKDPVKVVLSYLDAVSTNTEADITKYEYIGDRFDLYFYERDVTPKKFIPKDAPLNIVSINDISAAYNTPSNEKFFSVIYKNNRIDTLIYVLLIYDAEVWKVYGIV